MKKIIFSVFLLISVSIIGVGCSSHVHTYVKHEKQDATCELDGNIEYYTCDCGSCFVLNNGVYNEIPISDTIIGKFNHNIVTDEALLPTCVSNGLTEGTHCSLCGKVLVEQEIIYSEGHKFANVAKRGEEIPHHVYTACERCGEKTEYALPTIYFSSDEELGTDYVNCRISTSSCLTEYVIEDVKALVKIRGNWTATLSKKPYRIKFDKKQNLFGLNGNLKAKSWVLLADYADKSMVRNACGFYLAEQIYGTEYYSSDCCFVSVYINEEYQGVYLLVEQQQINTGRVEIFEDKNRESTDIGYFIEYDRYYYKEDPSIVFEIRYSDIPYFNNSIADESHFIKYYVIKNDLNNATQKTFIQDRVQKIWAVAYDALYGNHEDINLYPYKTIDANGDIIYDNSILNAYQALNTVIDVNSLVDTYLFNEIVQDMDIGYSSFYLSLDMSESGNKKLTFQAPWDFDWCFANSVQNINELYIGNYLETEPNHEKSNPWLMLVSNEHWFWELMREKWQALSENSVKDKLIDLVTDFTNNYRADIDKEFARWPEKKELLVWCSSDKTLSATSQTEDADNVVQYIKQRFSRLDYYFNNLGIINFAH